MAVSKWAYLDAEIEEVDYASGQLVTNKVFDPHRAQLRVMEDPSRFITATCGRRFGKSKFVANELLPEALHTKGLATTLKARGKRREFWSVGPQYSDSEKPFRVFYDACKRIGLDNAFDKPGTYYSMASKQMTVSLWDGAFIYSAKSAEHPDTLVGEALAGVHMEEAAKMKEVVWTQMIMPALGDYGGWVKFTTTPEGKNWYYRLHLNAIKESMKGWNGFRIPSWHNPMVYTETGQQIALGNLPMNTPIPEHEYTLDADVKRMVHMMAEHPEYTSFEIIQSLNLRINDEIAMQANNMPLSKFQQEIAADFTDFVGKVFKEFDEETHSRMLKFNPSWRTVAAVDYGYRNPSVWLLIQIGPWGEINILDELYQENLAPDEFAHEILRRGLCPDICTEFFPDPALPGDTKTLENIFRRAGKRIRARSHTGGELQNRLNLIRLALRQRITDHELSAPNWTSYPPVADKKRPRLMISTKCAKMLHEMGEYRYPETKDEMVETSTKRFELPMKKDDHTPEALGRFLAAEYHEMSTQYGGGARVSMARFLNSIGSTRYDHAGGYGDTPAGIPQTSNPVRRGTWMSGVGS